MSHTKELKTAIKMYLDNQDSPLSDYVNDETITAAFAELEQRNAELVEALTQISNYEGKDFVEFVCNIVEIKLAAHKEAK